MESIAEIWKDIQDYEGLYQVSNLGRVKSLVRVHYCKKERILTNIKLPNGYIYVRLCKDGKGKNVRVHRLVAVAFIPNPENLPQIDHINADKTNNNVNNLRWVTAKENIRNPLNMVHLIGKNNPMFGKKHSEETKEKMRKNHANFSGDLNPKARKVKNIETNEIFVTVKSAGKKYGVSDNSIRGSIKRNGKSAGYHWEYV
jgi:hypothetical protein